MHWDTTENWVLLQPCVTLGYLLPLSGPPLLTAFMRQDLGRPASFVGKTMLMRCFWPLASQCVVPANAASVSPWSL